MEAAFPIGAAAPTAGAVIAASAPEAGGTGGFIDALVRSLSAAVEASPPVSSAPLQAPADVAGVPPSALPSPATVPGAAPTVMPPSEAPSPEVMEEASEAAGPARPRPTAFVASAPAEPVAPPETPAFEAAEPPREDLFLPEEPLPGEPPSAPSPPLHVDRPPLATKAMAEHAREERGEEVAAPSELPSNLLTVPPPSVAPQPAEPPSSAAPSPAGPALPVPPKQPTAERMMAIGLPEAREPGISPERPDVASPPDFRPPGTQATPDLDRSPSTPTTSPAQGSVPTLPPEPFLLQAPQRPTLAEPAAPVPAMAGPAPPPPARQVASVAVALAFSPGVSDGFSLALDPAELGRVEIRVQREGDSHSVRVTAERPETLALLQRDRQELDRGLADAGLRVDPAGISFSLDTPDQGGGGGLGGEAAPGHRGSAAGGGGARPPAPEREAPPTRVQRGLLDLNI